MFLRAEDAIAWIENIKRLSPRQDLSRMGKCLAYLHNPEKKFKKIHVAGTNGKGSTVACITEILTKADFKVGRFISPYIVKFNERIAIGNQYISDQDLIKYANLAFNIAQKIMYEERDVVTFFEVITMIGFMYFAEQNVDYAVIEVGLGGRLDATNIIDAELSLITNIGYDHMHILGQTLPEIAMHKLGIVKKGNTLITTVDNALRDLFTNYVKEVGAEVIYIDSKLIEANLNETIFEYDNKVYHTNILGIHQKDNISLAIAACKFLLPDLSDTIIQKALDSLVWPGRLCIIDHKPLAIVDGAHNISGIEVLIESMKAIIPNKKIHVVFAVMHDKEFAIMVSLLETIAETITFTQIDYHRAMNPLELAKLTSEHAAFLNMDDAIRHVRETANDDDCILFTGSLYFISEILKKYKKD